MSHLLLLSIFLLLFHNSAMIATMASDPDPLQNFCKLQNIGVVCKNSSTATVEDFIFTGIKHLGKFSEIGLAASLVNVNMFPRLNTLDMSFVRADFEIGGINVPHHHPRATKIAFVLEWRVYSGFIDTQNKIFTKVIEKGEVMVFPKGLLYFQMNVGDTPATILGSFHSQNPGLLRVPNALFATGIQQKLLEKAFGLSVKEIDKLRNKFAPHPMT